MGIATAKLASSALNVWTRKHPTGKIAKIKNTVNSKLENKIPRIMQKIKAMKEKLKKPTINWFINGISAGYITGNIIENISGKTVWEHLESNNNEPTPAIEQSLTTSSESTPVPESDIEPAPDPTLISDPTPEPPVPSVSDFTNITLNPGDVVDLSSLTEGLGSSDAINLVEVMESVGKEAVFDKAVTLPDGRIMWHFKQLNGLDYAWFDSKTVQEVLMKAAEVSSKTL